MGTPSCFSCSSTGCSTRQETHQEANTLSSRGSPRNSFEDSPPSCGRTAGSENAGNGLPINTDGSFDGSWFNPIAKVSTTTAKSAAGNTNSRRFMLQPVGWRGEVRESPSLGAGAGPPMTAFRRTPSGRRQPRSNPPADDPTCAPQYCRQDWDRLQRHMYCRECQYQCRPASSAS